MHSSKSSKASSQFSIYSDILIHNIVDRILVSFIFNKKKKKYVLCYLVCLLSFEILCASEYMNIFHTNIILMSKL